MESFKKAVIAYLQEALPVQKGGAPYVVLNAYPKGIEKLPCVSVNQTAGGLERQFLGEGETMPYERDDGTFADSRSAFWRQGVEVALWATNPKTRDDMANTLRLALWRMVRYLSDTEDVHEMRVTEEGDGQDLEGRAPADVFSAVFNVSALVPLVIEAPVPIADDLEVTGEWSVGIPE